MDVPFFPPFFRFLGLDDVNVRLTQGNPKVIGSSLTFWMSQVALLWFLQKVAVHCPSTAASRYLHHHHCSRPGGLLGNKCHWCSIFPLFYAQVLFLWDQHTVIQKGCYLHKIAFWHKVMGADCPKSPGQCGELHWHQPNPQATLFHWSMTTLSLPEICKLYQNGKIWAKKDPKCFYPCGASIAFPSVKVFCTYSSL